MHNLGQEIIKIGQTTPVAVNDLAAAAAALGQAGAIGGATGFNPKIDYKRNSTEIRDAAKAIELVAWISTTLI
jgi:hypothetical protein